jgi:hypothetical protein
MWDWMFTKSITLAVADPGGRKELFVRLCTTLPRLLKV